MKSQKYEVRSMKNAFQTSDVKLSRAKGTQPEGIPVLRDALPAPGEAAACGHLRDGYSDSLGGPGR